ncbi:MAG: ATP-binding cassette domain-containing protein [Cellvibrionales bacterium TMED148]|nr:ABC transporter ATP-binding protein [Porticoccaceae bacterium]RPG88168.1 MAG: ATP-binding cassette domain-containing protein [Cellvibrionales bacterium TMED148]
MPLITLHNVLLSYGKPPLIDHINLTIKAGERVCLIGSNGAGKSTLLKILNGKVPVDDGVIKRAKGVRIAHLEQEFSADTEGKVSEVIAGGLGAEGRLAQVYYQLIGRVADQSDDKILHKLEKIQEELDLVGGWDLTQRVQSIVTTMNLQADTDMMSLSGGIKRQVMLARALVSMPDLLLLDEPTNHLDIEAIRWMEEFLQKWKGALIFISHDRCFMDNVATRLVEIDRGKLTEFDCDYSDYIKRKKEILEVEDTHNNLFDKRLSQEEVWIRQGIKARRTRNEGRVRALEVLRKEYAERRRKQGAARMTIQQSERSGKIVIDAEAVGFSFEDGNKVLENFSTLIQRGDKVGLIGANGAGKTTLLQLLLGELAPQSGNIKIGTKLNVAYFDQYRSVLDETKSVQDTVSDGRNMLEVGGRSRHVISYLQDFLFDPDRCRQPVSALSGGERNRLLLAKLFTVGSNVLVLDEPTNDLDINTLDLLEELLIDYKGTILLVSHDRAFLNNVVTRTLVFEGDAIINEYGGGYDDWLRQRPVKNLPPTSKVVKTKRKKGESVETRFKKRSFKDQRELDQLPVEIERTEMLINEISEQLSQPSFYESDHLIIAAAEQQLVQLQQQLNDSYARWEFLEGQ